MKSEKAKQFLETKQPGDIAQYEISRGKAEKAVDIAEAKMREKAIRAYLESCLHFDKGTCLRYKMGYGETTDECTCECEGVKKFIQQLDK